MTEIHKEQIDRRDLRLHIITLEAQLAQLRAMRDIQTELKTIGKAIGSYTKQVELIAKASERVKKLRQLLDDPVHEISEKVLAEELRELDKLCDEGLIFSEF